MTGWPTFAGLMLRFVPLKAPKCSIKPANIGGGAAL